MVKFWSIQIMCLCIWMDVDVSAAVPHSKHMDDLIIESSKFPAAQPPDPNQPCKIETDYWPCPPSLAVIGNTLSRYQHDHNLLHSFMEIIQCTCIH